ncbi:lasso peptide biosynthesis B2 protein [Mumia sp. DW29H23]|uniref:lasso peptide biosynthesis B2 protein n=1 Tax=Mumia sp. DW29H23 TaxID=3421241 RepID=UPI003D683B24
MMRLVRSVRPRDVLALVRLTLLAAYVETGLRWWRLPRLASSLGLSVDQHGVASSDPFDASVLEPRERRNLDLAARVLRRGPFHDTCLRQSLVFGHELRRHDPRVVLGVRKVDGEIRAHAWLEIGARSLEPEAVATFEVMRQVGSS